MTGTEMTMFETVVVGADASPTAAEAVRQAIEITKMSNGALHIVTAYRPQRLTTEAGGEYRHSLDTTELAESLVTDLASRARIAGVPVETHVSSGDPASAICDVAAEVNADLVVVGNKGMKGVRRLLGSVPNSVAHDAPCSVLVACTG
jgi:nucleotide-binding universal stress UspA family protein